MIEKIYDSLNIPSSCKVDKKIFKKQYLDNFTLKQSEKRILSDDIENITLKYILTKDNINIQPFVNDTYDYETISFMEVNIKDIKNYKKIASIVNILPRPIILLLVCKNQICINLNLKRINQSDKTKLVIEEENFSNWMDLKNLNKNEEEFVQSLDIGTLSFTHFFTFYKEFLDKIIALNLSKYSGSLSKEANRETLDKIVLLEDDIASVKNQIKKENDFSIKVNLNVELKKLNDKLTKLKENI